MADKREAEMTLDDALKMAKASPFAMVAVWYKSGEGQPLFCHQFPFSYFPLADLDLATGLLVRAFNKVRERTEREAPPELPRPARPEIFRGPNIRREQQVDTPDDFDEEAE